MINILRHTKRETGMMKWWKRLIILLCLSDIRNKASFGISSILGDGNGSERKARIGSIISGGVDGISDVVSGGVDGVSDVISGGVNGVGDVISGGVNGILGLFGGSENQGAPGTSAPSQPDSGYLVLKVDLLSSDSANMSALIQPVMAEVKQLLETGLQSGTFKLTWVAYEQ